VEAWQEDTMTIGGKRVLITGSSRGIGRGIALKLAEDGARVAIHYYQNEAAARDTLAQVRARGGDGLLVQADVTRADEVRPSSPARRSTSTAGHP
jgi:NAD(P)-dependent dehydrogenase (short-subunit alcohol dehydrogenase family)